MSHNALTPQLRYTLPVFVLLSFAGFYFIVLHMALSKAPDRFEEVHTQSYVPLSVMANLPLPIKKDNPLLDKIFTPLISFFVAAFGDVGKDSASYPITLDFVWSFGAAIQLPLIESARPGAHRTWLLTIPMAWGVLYQRVSGGWILPLWLLVWMRSHARTTGQPLARTDAEAVLAGWWAGHTLPAMAMLIPGMPSFKCAPVWIAFPLLMSAGRAAYLALARRIPALARRDPRASGYVATQLVFLSSLALGAIAHAHVVIVPGLAAATVHDGMSGSAAVLVKLRGLATHLYQHYVPPSFAIPSPAETTAITGVKHFVQFDVLIVFSAVWIAGVWDLALRRRASPPVKGMSQGMWIATVAPLLLVGGALLGPGCATAALFAWREKLLEDERYKEKAEDEKYQVKASEDEKKGRELAAPSTGNGFALRSPTKRRTSPTSSSYFA